ncbi:hypothetical protein R5O11_03505 [Tenacibaculum maritimum]|uniref:hypothetical protein n=1 Tax=Tenacibaculum maritimum TaxID=107401 RepID=UPI00388E8B5C
MFPLPTITKLEQEIKIFEQFLRSVPLLAAPPQEAILWEYEGNFYSEKFELYIAILSHEIAGQFGIINVPYLINILLRKPSFKTHPKLQSSMEYSVKGMSLVSKYVSIASSSFTSTTTNTPKVISSPFLKITLTNIVGFMMGYESYDIQRGDVLTYDIEKITRNSQMIFDSVTHQETLAS